MWPLPFVNEEMKGQGFFYPKIPEITMADINMVVKDASKQHNASYNKTDFDSDPNQYIEKALKKYGGKTFTISHGVNGGQTRDVYLPTDAQRQQKTIIVE